MASRKPITLTSAEVRALAERLRARATSVVLRDAPSQQSDGILAAGALAHSVAELQTLRDEIERAASSTSDMAQHLRELLRNRGAHDRGTVTVRFGTSLGWLDVAACVAAVALAGVAAFWRQGGRISRSGSFDRILKTRSHTP